MENNCDCSAERIHRSAGLVSLPGNDFSFNQRFCLRGGLQMQPMNIFYLQANIPSGAEALNGSVNILRGIKPPPPSVSLTSFALRRVQHTSCSQD